MKNSRLTTKNQLLQLVTQKIPKILILFLLSFYGVAGNTAEKNFSIAQYKGNGSDNQVSTGVDIMSDGGLVIVKGQANITSNNTIPLWMDSHRPNGEYLDSTVATAPNVSADFQGFSASGFDVSGSWQQLNGANEDYYAFSFAEKPGFFDIVTYIGDGTSARQIAHDLNYEVGMLVIKAYDASNNGAVWHKYLSGADWGLNLFGYGGDPAAPSGWFANTQPTENHFYVTNSIATNTAGVKYVAYLFADNPDAGISVGSYTGNETDGTIASFPWQPDLFLLKPTNTTLALDWTMWSPTFGPQKYLMLNRAWEGLPDSLGTAVHVNENGSVVKETINPGHEITFNESGKQYVYLAITESPDLNNLVIIDFEDLPIGSRTSFSSGGISGSYKTLVWGYGTSAGVTARTFVPASNGKGWGSNPTHNDNSPIGVQGKYAWNYYNPRSLWIDFGKNVSFKGIDLANAGAGEPTNAADVQVFAYNELDQLVGQSGVISLTETFQSFSANYPEMRYLEIVAGNQVGNENYTEAQLQMAGMINIDNILYTVPNGPPVVNSDTYHITSDGTYSLAILANDSDEDISSVSINVSDTSVNGALLSVVNNQILYTTTANFIGDDSFTYTLTDAIGLKSASATVSLAVSQIPQAGLVVEYLFDDPAVLGKDTSGNGLHGVVNGIINSGEGVAGSSSVFDGSGYIEVPDDDRFSLNDNGMTISVWTKTGELATRRGIVSKGQSGAFEWSVENGILGGSNIGAGYNAHSGSSIRYEGIAGQLSQWNHYVFVFTGKTSTSSISIYKNGVLQQDNELYKNDTYTNAYQNTLSKLWIGQSYGSGGINPYVGELDRVRIYDGKLTEEEINSLHSEPTIPLADVTNMAPIVREDNFTAYSNHPIILSILLNDTDEDIGTISLILPDNSQSQGAINLTETGVSYLSAIDFTGSDSFTYNISDSEGLTSNTATVFIDVKPESSLVKLRPDNYLVYKSQEQTFAITGNDSFDREAGLTIQLPAASENGATMTLTNNIAIYKPADGFEGNDTFVYSIFDQNNNLLDSTLVTVNVAASGASLPLVTNMVLTPDILDPIVGTLSFDYLNVYACSIEQEKNIDVMTSVELLTDTGAYQSGSYLGQVPIPRPNLSSSLNLSCIGESNVIVDYVVTLDGSESGVSLSQPVIQSLMVEPQAVMVGQAQTLTISFDNASRCLMRSQDNPSLASDRLIADNGSQVINGSGSLTLTDTTQAKGEYLIVTCENPDGELTQSFVKRVVNLFETDKSQMSVGQPITLSWHLPDIKSCNEGSNLSSGSLIIKDYEVSPVNIIKWQCENYSGEQKIFSTDYEVLKLSKANNFRAVEETQ